MIDTFRGWYIGMDNKLADPGGVPGTSAPPLSPISFLLMQFCRKKGQMVGSYSHLWNWRPFWENPGFATAMFYKTGIVWKTKIIFCGYIHSELSKWSDHHRQLTEKCFPQISKRKSCVVRDKGPYVTSLPAPLWIFDMIINNNSLFWSQ